MGLNTLTRSWIIQPDIELVTWVELVTQGELVTQVWNYLPMGLNNLTKSWIIKLEIELFTWVELVTQGLNLLPRGGIVYPDVELFI